MTTEKLAADDLSNIPYGLKSIRKILWIFLAFIIFLIGILSIFPVKTRIEQFLRGALASDRRCPISFSTLDMEAIPPQAILNDISIPPSCYQGQVPLNISKAKLQFRGLSFSPFGLAFKAITNALKTQIDTYLVLGWGFQQIKVDDTKIDLKELTPFIPNNLKLRGNALLNAFVRLENQTPQSGQIQLESKNAQIPSQQVEIKAIGSSLDLPNINIQTLILRSTIKDSLVDIQKIQLGNPSASLQFQGSGNIKLNAKNSQLSQLNLATEFALIDPDLKEQLSVLDLFLSSYPKKGEFYQINIGGTLGSPQVLQ